ncbi:MAG: hypothetical protein Dasosvirus9_5 [Dasosvirus sp.]|uniref:Uncharacterized protein n=1 Tax=Dasosvirus sp. TaxID=2487764 RepID=A0A3G4ZUA6_9VIRU|nr:MAG: hypothetical protein Dasosvirus9_5 [Dasosvirus sp.]
MGILFWIIVICLIVAIFGGGITIGPLLLIVIVLCLCYSSFNPNMEMMAPLDFGTYNNNYPRGACQDKPSGSDCNTAECKIESNISNDKFCAVQCAQGVTQDERKGCFNKCSEMMTYCR